jgi:ribosomal protein L11 methyltransferase
VTLTALVVHLSGREADGLSDALIEAGALSVSCDDLRDAGGAPPDLAEPGEPASWPRVRLTALCGSEHAPGQLLRQACEASGVAMRQHDVFTVRDADWVAKSRSEFGPIHVSQRLWIVPSWSTPPDPDAINLMLDPGLAFGTGSHPTTRLCLRWLERQIAGGETVLDYGCGSGILAIAALKLGAGHAVGVDIDPNAIAIAESNAKRNGVAADFLQSRAPFALTADLVVANILANPLKVLAPLLAQRCRPGGRIALAGILRDQAEDVAKCYAQWFTFAQEQEDEGWVCLSGIRK